MKRGLGGRKPIGFRRAKLRRTTTKQHAVGFGGVTKSHEREGGQLKFKPGTWGGILIKKKKLCELEGPSLMGEDC